MGTLEEPLLKNFQKVFARDVGYQTLVRLSVL